MRTARVFQRLLGVEQAVVERVELVEERGEEVLVAAVRPYRSRRSRCSRCDRKCPGYDAGDGRRRWRGLDLGTTRTFLEADAPRVACPDHGVVVAGVPWARPGARCTRAFEDTCAWLAAHAAFTVLAALMRISWRTVAAVVARVVADLAGRTDRLDGLARIGIDEISHRRGHRYLTCVVDHDTGRLVWAAAGRDTATLLRFFDALGPQRCAQLTHVSADGAEWIHAAVHQRAPQAVLALDPFHVVSWATDALDEVRRGLWNDLRRDGKPDQAAELKGTRWALIKNPEDLTCQQRTSLAQIAATNRGLYRAYLLKEQLRAVFKVKGIRRQTTPRRLAGLGETVPATRLRQARQNHRTLPGVDLQQPRPRPVQRPLRSDQHPPAGAHPTRLRLPHRRSTDRDGHAHPRRPLPTTPRPTMIKSPTEMAGDPTILSGLEWNLNSVKTRFMKKGGPQYVTGLYVGDATRAHLPRRTKRRLRQLFHYVVKYGFDDCDETHVIPSIAQLRGWFRHLHQVDPVAARRLIEGANPMDHWMITGFGTMPVDEDESAWDELLYTLKFDRSR